MRWWAIRTLGKQFTRNLQVTDDHEFVVEGPYRHVRHPSYTGLLLALLGIGVANGTLVSVAAVLVLPLPAIIWRIHVEEAALETAFGPVWLDYVRRTHRLVPHLW